MLLLLISSFIIVCMLLIIFSRMFIHASFVYTEEEYTLIIKMYFHRMRLFKRTVSVQGDENTMFKETSLLEAIDYYEQKLEPIIYKLLAAYKPFNKLLEESKWHYLKWTSHIGTGEPSTTGMAIGGAWILKGTLLGEVHKRSTIICRPKISITPYFEEQLLASEIDCIVSIRTGQTIYTVFKELRKISINEEVYM